MTTLADIAQTDPATSETPSLGAARIRALEAALLFSFAVEHALTGEHKIPRGPLSSRPAAGYDGRLFILETVGLIPKLQYDNGVSWVELFDAELYATLVDLSAHIDADPIDHPNNSVTAAKIIAGAILKKHLDGSGSATSISSLVDGSNADAFHTHTFATEDGTITPSSLTAVKDGEVTFGKSGSASATITSSSYVKLKEIKTLIAGTITASYTSTVNYTIVTPTSKSVAYSDSGIAVVKNDLVQVWGRMAGAHFFTRVYKNNAPIGAEHDNSAPGGSSFSGYVSNFILSGDWFCEKIL